MPASMSVLGSRDTPQRVIENRTRVASGSALPLKNWQPFIRSTPQCLHRHAKLCRRAPAGGRSGDGNPGLVLGVLAADCGPILFADAENRVIGAAHAGWKGALYGVLESTIEAMIALGAKRETITAVLGPRSAPPITRSARNLSNASSPSTRITLAFSPSVNADHSMFDLQGLTVARLKAAGVNAAMTGIAPMPTKNAFLLPPHHAPQGAGLWPSDFRDHAQVS